VDLREWRSRRTTGRGNTIHWTEPGWQKK